MTDLIGKHDWYDLGADFLLKAQTPDGARRPQGPNSGDTVYAILFLKRATKALEDVATTSARDK